MKKILLFAIIMAVMVGVGFAAKHTVTNVGFTFSPDTLIIEAGEDVEFSLGIDHNAVEVTQETWDADGNTPKSGGFSVPFGGDEVVFPNAGTYYYVCEPHASAGMKGVIIVNEATAISSVSNDISTFNVFPNPATDFITFAYTLDSRAMVKILLINSAGVEVANILKGTLDPGQYKNTYSLNKDLTPGIYYVRFVSDNQSNINKMVIK